MHVHTATTCLIVAMLVLCGAGRPARAARPLQHLRDEEPPVFREGHTLPALTRWGWRMPVDVAVELAENWGYALEYRGEVENLDNPESAPARLCALAAEDPDRYPLAVLLPRPLLSAEFRRTLPEKTWCHTAEGKLPDGKKILSPEAPDAVFKKVGRTAAQKLVKIRRKAPITICLNGGEYGMGVYGFAGKYWKQDPEVMKAKGKRSWLEYISACKSRQEAIIAKTVKEAVPDLGLYIWYHTDGAHANRYGRWWHWVGATVKDWMKVSDLPSSSIYYRHFNSGWTGGNDMLTMALNATGRAIAAGEPLSYNWQCAGWRRKKMGEKAFADLRLYMGYLKCYYVAGQIGGIAGYFSRPKGGFNADTGEGQPHWLRQMTVLARAHALFSHLEEDIREGRLLPGPNKHVWSRSQPAYEFPTGDKGARVVVRRNKKAGRWLIAAWAADGKERTVTAGVPELGKVELLARDCGSVYHAVLKEGKPALTLLDEDGMRPSAGFAPEEPKKEDEEQEGEGEGE